MIVYIIFNIVKIICIIVIIASYYTVTLLGCFAKRVLSITMSDLIF